ncbi:MAG: type II toxin-antitoxin system VapC family toxin [Chloroflexota bacterium]|nr:type II toxin-antitoxin system VapC family toxin [Chloroflexota bacterium]
MQTKYLLDTNVLIYALRRDLGVLDWLDSILSTHHLYTSVASRVEVFAGMRPREEQMTEALLASLTSLSVTVPIADRAGRMIYKYGRQGFQVSFPDALIAATALEQDLTLVTSNVRHFPMLGDQLSALSEHLPSRT